MSAIKFTICRFELSSVKCLLISALISVIFSSYCINNVVSDSDFYIEDNKNVTQNLKVVKNSSSSHKIISSPLHRKSRALRTHKSGAQSLPILSDNEDLNKELLNDDASGDDSDNGSEDIDLSSFNTTSPFHIESHHQKNECGFETFRCNDGKCLNRDKQCDRIYDCTDGEDETQCSLCSSNQFMCADGSCIALYMRCDGRIDCRTDRSDEEHCPHKSDKICTPYEFRCSDGTCIDFHLKCNSRADCSDRSDERNCQCSNDEFRCQNSQCIPEIFRCDHKYDCEDGTDEYQCHSIECKPKQLKCRSGQCIDESKHCNNVFDCADHSDEYGCADRNGSIENCQFGQFQCSDGQCIDEKLRCNKRYDCIDSSDETNCENVKYCRQTEFQCSNGECIELSKKCDQNKDCFDGSDETNCQLELCSLHEFECKVNGKCISESLRCDSYYDCEDFSDEVDCETRLCRLSQFRCGTGLCIDRALLCNGITDCPDRRDETMFCWLCLSGQYICANGQCIDMNRRCDGVPHCSDRSDEIDCLTKEVNIQVYPERQSIRQGQEVVIRCRDESENRLPVQWSRPDGKPLPYGSSDLRGRLTIANIQPEDNGVYICSAIGHSLGSRGSQKAAFLSVQSSLSYESLIYYLPQNDNTFEVDHPIQPIPTLSTTAKPTVIPRPPGVCAKSEATCQNGECISREYVCDGDFDCQDRSDELNCIHYCEPNQFQCANNRCILKIWRCDSDDDCGDNSDEELNCEQPVDSGSPCRWDEYKCISGDQCIPRSYQCDGEFDCQDKSDEIGCSAPTFVSPPPETVSVTEGETISISCRAVGTPIPLISWRLNWNHIPHPPRVTVESIDGLGTVTIREAKVSDQGAWSCEAINSKDSVLSSNDALLVVKPKHAVCQFPSFNDFAQNPSQCLRCFCFGVSDRCHSSNLHVISLSPQSRLTVIPLIRETNGSYTDVSRQYPPNQNAISYNPNIREYSIKSDVMPASTPDGVYFYWNLPTEMLSNKLYSFGSYIRYTIRYREPYLPKAPNIPDIILRGNGINLYHYYKSEYNPKADTQIKVRLWEGEWHKSDLSARSEIPPLFDATTREDIMIALQNLDYIYVKATYDEQIIDSSILDLEMDISVLSNASASEQSVFVEKCLCPEGYSGSSCEECSAGYVRQSVGRYLGRCVRPSIACICNSHSDECDQRTNICLNCAHNTEGPNCEKCKRGYYGNAISGREDGCRPCPCPHIEPSYQYSPTCYLDPTEGDIVCDACPLGFEGRRCERCAQGYEGNPITGIPCEQKGMCSPQQFRCGNGTCIDIRLRCNNVYDCVPEGNDESGCECSTNNFRCFDGGCIDRSLLCNGIADCFDNSDESSTYCSSPETHCDPIGSLTTSPSPSTGLCHCKPSVTGARCDQCSAHSFHLSKDAPNGCIDCFCSGVTKSCTDSKWLRDYIELKFTNDPNVVKLIDLNKTAIIDKNLRIDYRNHEIIYRDFALQPKLIYYWSLPTEFLGNKVMSYGGGLNYSFRYERGFLSRPSDEPDVQMTGNGITVIYRHNKPFQSSITNSISIPLYENHWLSTDGQRVSRDKFMTVLADIDSILLKATHSSDAISVGIFSVTLDIASDRSVVGTGGGTQSYASSVELCRCPVGYQGLSCEQCIPGYTRTSTGSPLSLCEPCFCNGHSSDCDGKTGICKNCVHNTSGDFCQLCSEGFSGDPSRGTPYDCSSNNLPITPCLCDSRGSVSLECDFNQNCLCKENVRTVNCDQCSDGYFNLEALNPKGCTQCYCSGVTRRCSSSSYFRSKITLRLQDLPNPYEHHFQLTNRYKSHVFSEGIIVNPTQNEVSFGSFNSDFSNSETLFWALPELFLGNKLTSYGGRLHYTQQFKTRGTADLYSDADIEITGNGVTLIYVNRKVLSPGETQSYDIELKEGFWQKSDANRHKASVLANREHFLLVLSNIEDFLIRATFHPYMEQTIIADISLDTAVPQNTGQNLAVEVEQCVCPPGYIGLSCEQCAPGYIRDTTTPGYGRCTRCNCNSHSETCDPNTGFCVWCRHNTVGESCDKCAERFYGDPTRGTPEDCKPCPCPLTTRSNNFSPTCRQDSDGQPTCNACATGYSGRNCEQCSFGYRGNPLQPGGRCELISGTGPTIRVRIDEPKVQRVPIGSVVTFRCNGVSQISEITYNLVWTKESGSLPSRASEASGMLTIPDVRPEHNGVYICTGSDLQSVAQDSATLIVETSDQPAVPRVRIEPYYQEVNVGDGVEFICTVEGFPKPLLSWTGGRNNILNPSATFSNGVFKIPSARKSDESEYFCTASNSAGTDSVRTILFVKGREDIQIGAKPHVTISPVNYEGRRGETVKFDCKVTGSDELKWTYSGGDLPQDSRQVGGLLILARISDSHQGLYTCSGHNIYGTTQAQARLSIESGRAIPTAKIEPERQTIVQGQNGELRCITSGNPSPTISWQKIGGNLVPERHKTIAESLLIENAVIEDRGLYVCRADNREGSAQSSAIVEIERREIPSIEIYPESSQVVQRGGSALFQCRVTAGVPVPAIEWRRGDGSLFTSSTEIIDGVLRFHRVTGDEDGAYICTGENIAGRVTAQAVLRIEGAPTVRVLQSSPYRVRPNERIRLECLADSGTGPKASVIWRKVLPQLYTGIAPPIPSIEVDGRTVLEIPNVTASDSGVYVCTCTSLLGTNEERIQLIVEDDSVVPDVVVEDRVVTVAAGNRAEMRCFVRGTARSIELRWIRSGNQTLPSSSRVENGILYIDDVKPQDSGEYQCLGVVDGQRVLFEARARLAVVAPPRIQLQPTRQTARPGDTVSIDCIASGDQPITIDWSKIGSALPPSVYSHYGRLEFRGIQSSDAGRFLCTAVNAAGKAEGVAEVIVDDSDYRDILHKEETAFVGSNIELKCQFGGTPPPTIRWTKDSVDLQDNAREVNNELWIRNVRLDNAGRYVCTATSNLGILSRDYVVLNVRVIPTLEVKVIPSKDRIYLGDELQLQCLVSGDSSARVEWKGMSQSGPFPNNVIIRGNVLIVNGVKSENGGIYRCTVDTYAGTYNGDYVLAIQEMPTISPELVEKRSAPFGSTVVMDCQTTLEPPVSYTWAKQGDSLSSDTTVDDEGVITIRGVKGQDSGTYICTAKNQFVTMDIPTVLVVTGVVPYFSQSPVSYMVMPTLPDAYLSFEVQISFRPEVPNGLILYNGQIQHSGDFISLGLRDSRVEYRYELGAGVVLLKSEKAIEMKKWHSVRISRNEKQGILQIDDQMPVRGSASGRFKGLDLLEPLYIGGVPDFSQISKQNGFDVGFVGCVSLFKVGTVAHELINEAQVHSVTNCETCTPNPCANQGVCQETALSIYGRKCVCAAGFSGNDCEKIGDACYPGVCGLGRCVNKIMGGFDCFCPFGRTGLKCEKEIIILEPALSDDAYIAYPTPTNSLRKMNLKLKVKPKRLEDGLLMYSAQNHEGQGDFTSLAIKNRTIEFRFDTGSGPAILRSSEKLETDQWVNIVAERDLRQGSLTVGDSAPVFGESPGHTRGLNLRLPLYIGGYDKLQVTIAPLAEITHGFYGCVGHIEVNSVAIDLVNSVVDSSNVGDCGSDSPCQRSPCLNGGDCREIDITEFECICVDAYSGRLCERRNGVCELTNPCKNGAECQNLDFGQSFKCFCSLGFKGETCTEREEFMDPESVRLTGNGFITLSGDYLPHSLSLADEVIKFSITTQEDNGLIFFHGQTPDTNGQEKDFMAVALNEGRIEFSFELGSGLAQIRSSAKVNDGFKHSVVIKRKGKEGSVVVDNSDHTYGESSGGLQSLNTRAEIYIGGLPEFGDRFTGFVGCISDVEIGNSGLINIVTSAKSARNVRACDDDLISSGSMS